MVGTGQLSCISVKCAVHFIAFLQNAVNVFNMMQRLLVRRFLQMDGEETVASDGHFLHDRAPFTMRRLGLCEERQEEILGGNIRDFIGGEPRPVDAEETLMLCAALRERMAELVLRSNDFHPDASELNRTEQYFSQKYYEE